LALNLFPKLLFNNEFFVENEDAPSLQFEIIRPMPAFLSAAKPGLSTPERSDQIKKLVQRKMLFPISPNARHSILGFEGSHLRRRVIHVTLLRCF
jgi:hypothetical protein